MSLITILWSMGAAAALTLALVYGGAWLLNRRLLPNLLFALVAIATALCARTELGMMHSTTPAEFGEWMRWYHIGVFLNYVGIILFVRGYLGTGRLWLAWSILGVRAVLLAVNLLSSYPNLFFREIISLQQVRFLGEQVSIVGDAVVSPWFWVARITLLAAIVYLSDAAIESWRMGDRESRRKGLVVLAGFVAPTVIITVTTHIAVIGVGQLPYLDTPSDLIMLTVMAYELSREIVLGDRMHRELEELRGNLRQLGRVSIMGHLASALAHELNQPLGAILRNAEAAELHLQTVQPDLDELRSIVADIRKDDRRAAEIIERMRSLIKRRVVDMRPLSVEELVQDAVALVRTEAASKQIRLTNALEPGLPPVLGDRVHVTQVLLNLIVNGMEAAQSRPVGARGVQIAARAEGRQVELSVRDSGPGIPAADINRIFDPLFSTKSAGLGMGLAISRTIVEAHGGRLWAERGSQETGATLCFLLPRAEQAPV